MAKSPDAFRTISEVADWLGVQAHVLRFWESKFTQVKPIKRAGGRRYYRPADMLLLGGLKKLLHEDGLTIKGAQKMLREKGVAHVADLSQPLDDLTIAVIEGTSEEITVASEVPMPDTEILPEGPEVEEIPEEDTVSVADAPANPTGADIPAAVDEVLDVPAAATGDLPETVDEEPALVEPPQDTPVEAKVDELTAAAEETVLGDDDQPNAPETEAIPTFRARSRTPAEPMETEPDALKDADVSEAEPSRDESGDELPAEPPKEPVKPRIIDVGPLPDLSEIPAEPSAISMLSSLTRLTADEAQEIKPLLARLTRLRASMSSPRKDLGKD